MMLTRWNPIGDMERLRREIDQVFEGQESGRWTFPFSRFSFLPGQAARAYPLLNVREDTDAYHVDALAPGIDPQTLKVSVTGRQLTLEGEKTGAGEEIKTEAYHRCERSTGKFVRSLTLPVEIDAEQVKAEYCNGLLSLTLPKAASARPRQITINVN
jgi:HSP20 family protein